jgi:hypothetical protein
MLRLLNLEYSVRAGERLIGYRERRNSSYQQLIDSTSLPLPLLKRETLRMTSEIPFLSILGETALGLFLEDGRIEIVARDLHCKRFFGRGVGVVARGRAKRGDKSWLPRKGAEAWYFSSLRCGDFQQVENSVCRRGNTEGNLDDQLGR